MAGFFFGYDLKSELKKRLKPFSKMKAKYGIDAIYRTGKIKRFSKTSQDLGLSGVPTSRRSTRPLDEIDVRGTKNRVDIRQPIWYAPELEVSSGYCYEEIERWEQMQKMFEKHGTPIEEFSKKNPRPADCGTYQYVPRDTSRVKGKRLLFLDITGKADPVMADGKKIYTLDENLMLEIFKVILEKYKNDIITDSDDEPYMCVNSPCKDTFTIKEILTSYCKSRSSELDIDTFFTLELFHIIKELKIEKELDFVFMGYFHGNVFSTELGEDEITGHMPAEFAIPYGNSINKNYMDFTGQVDPSRKKKQSETTTGKRKKDDDDHHISSASKKLKGGKSSKRTKNKRHNKKTIRNEKVPCYLPR